VWLRVILLGADDPGGDRRAERQERVEQVGHLEAHRGQARRAPGGARVAADGAPGAHEGVRGAHLPEEQLLPRRRPRRAAEARPRAPAQGAGPQRAAAGAQAGVPAPPGPPAQGQGAARRRRRAGHRRHAQGPRPPAQEGQDLTLFRPCARCRRRQHPRQARPWQAAQGTPRRAQRDGGGLTPLCSAPPHREGWGLGRSKKKSSFLSDPRVMLSALAAPLLVIYSSPYLIYGVIRKI
jgi:hypothetical protein